MQTGGAGEVGEELGSLGGEGGGEGVTAFGMTSVGDFLGKILSFFGMINLGRLNFATGISAKTSCLSSLSGDT